MTNATAERPLHSVSVAGIVVREDGRVLVIRRADNGAWEPPGGILERDERPEEGVLREVAEETGIEVEVERLTGVYKNLALGVIALVFRCRPVGGVEKLSEESTAIRWLTPDEAKSAMREVFAVRVADALDGGSPHVRSHDGVRLVVV
ncbi:NUDIX domain-containing protein [Streptomyces virginiae]|uniref:NUDIX domain-containing protein n=1 Tax=Streptomyces virginiae TaxID=1961 RepID=UPI00345001A0